MERGCLTCRYRYNISSNEPHWGVSDIHFIVGIQSPGRRDGLVLYKKIFSKISWELVSNFEKACNKKEIDCTIVLKNLQNFV